MEIGFGMWNPRAHVDYDLLNIIHPAPNGYKPDFLIKNAYDGFDLLPLNQAVPDGDVDVHAIAIATTNPAPDLDHSWIEDSDSDSDGGNLTSVDGVVNAEEIPPPGRRWLRDASELAFRKGAELFPPSTVVKNRISLPENEGKNKEVIKTSSSDTPLLRRQLENATATTTTNDTTTDADPNAIVPGRGWELHGWTPVKGFCDGSAQSECNRPEDSNCMLSGANDKHYDVWGNSLSGWLVFTVPKVREGIILARMEWWCGGKNKLTKDWTEVNNGKTTDTTPWNPTDERRTREEEDENEQRQRNLKMTPEQLVPEDFEMDWAINGVVKTMKREEWLTHIKEFVKNVAVWPLLDDPSMAQKDWDGEPVEVAIRFRSKINIQNTWCISHVYYA
jgi:hypothetical protein